MLKRKRTKESGSQAPIPEKKFKREAPVERLWERSREGRKETNRDPSKQKRKERTGNQPGRKWKAKGKKETGAHRESHCEAENGKRQKGKNRKLSS